MIESSGEGTRGETWQRPTNFPHVCNYVASDQLTTSKGENIKITFFRVKADATLKNIQFYKEDDEKRW